MPSRYSFKKRSNKQTRKLETYIRVKLMTKFSGMAIGNGGKLDYRNRRFYKERLEELEK
jgi:hypothetical protein